ncbi:MAG: hypothetical protein KatS3mg062_0451 [Tepidiforma sp.]|nr:MAG: hypothetical protein KatS3mg062_0451 [Tepidiforma sp.]
MRTLSPLPVFLAAAACCSALGLAALRMESPAGAAPPASQMSADSAPPHALLTPPVTEVTPAGPTAAPPSPPPARAVAEARATPEAPASEQAAPVASPTPPALPTQTVAALPATVSQPVEITPVEDRAVALLAAMNAARAAEGLQPLSWDADLASVALARARDLIEHDYFDHYGPDGRSAFSELAVRGIGYGLAGENLARNNYPEARTVEAAFQGLMASPGHRANILEPRFTSVGIAAVRSGRTWLFVTVFTD